MPQSDYRRRLRGFEYVSLPALAESRSCSLSRLPFSIRILLENLLRHADSPAVDSAQIDETLGYDPDQVSDHEIAFHPARVVLQDFTGVPAVVDLAAMRDALGELGGDPQAINPLFPSELVIDHSVQVDSFGHKDSLTLNRNLEYERNVERYQLLRWAQGAFNNFQVVPPATGIVHQVNLEYLARGVVERDGLLYPDTLVGTDSHTPMINGIGVLGWGVGGIEAEAAMLGQPINMLLPKVVGVRLVGAPRPGITATDIVLTLTAVLRAHGVVGKFVEFFGAGLDHVSVETRATIANMSPEFGSTCAIFPVDSATIAYLAFTGRSQQQCELVEEYFRAQDLFRTSDTPDPAYDSIVEFDLDAVEATISGPKRPQDRTPLSHAKAAWHDTLRSLTACAEGAALPSNPTTCTLDGDTFELDHGNVVIAAITSCTNTSNPSVMLAAGLLAKKAHEKGLSVKPWVKTSLAPGSKVVTRYLERSELLPHLEALRFHVVGYGCTTCIGNSGPLPAPISDAIARSHLVAVAVLSGNRNFEGRINSDVRANYLASPPLVVAYALAGRMDFDFATEPLGNDSQGEPVFLRDIWPTPREIQETVGSAIAPSHFLDEYASVFEGDEQWRALPTPEGAIYHWDETSTYVKRPPFFEDLSLTEPALTDIAGARVLLMLGDSVTTDHISPAGSIPLNSAAGRYLTEHGVSPREFNSYGARRGNHEVMMRGTFANVRIKNQIAPGTEGGFSTHLPTGEVDTVFDVAMRYRTESTPLVVLGGKEYGSGSSRDWAAKGTLLLGVRAVIAESYERIHRSNLVGMGVLPLEYLPGQSRDALGLTGREVFSITGISSNLEPRSILDVTACDATGLTKEFQVRARIDTAVELRYYQHGGILPFVLRQLAGKTRTESGSLV